MTELRDDMTKAIEHQIFQLVRLRRCSHDVAKATVAQSFAANLRDSRGTSMEPYWEAMVTIADTI